MTAVVTAVCRDAEHRFSKVGQSSIELVAGVGVAGDAHKGSTVQHLSRLGKSAALPNLRQVHLMHAELHAELQQKGFNVWPGALGENITTSGLDVLALPTATRLHLGATAVLEVTGLRTPCFQLDKFQQGLLAAVQDRDSAGKLIRKSGIMAIVLVSGVVQPGDAIRVELPPAPHRPLEPV